MLNDGRSFELCGVFLKRFYDPRDTILWCQILWDISAHKQFPSKFSPSFLFLTYLVTIKFHMRCDVWNMGVIYKWCSAKTLWGWISNFVYYLIFFLVNDKTDEIHRDMRRFQPFETTSIWIKTAFAILQTPLRLSNTALCGQIISEVTFEYLWIWTSLNKFGQIWTCLNKFGQVYTNLDNFRPIFEKTWPHCAIGWAVLMIRP